MISNRGPAGPMPADMDSDSPAERMVMSDDDDSIDVSQDSAQEDAAPAAQGANRSPFSDFEPAMVVAFVTVAQGLEDQGFRSIVLNEGTQASVIWSSPAGSPIEVASLVSRWIRQQEQGIAALLPLSVAILPALSIIDFRVMQLNEQTGAESLPRLFAAIVPQLLDHRREVADRAVTRAQLVNSTNYYSRALSAQDALTQAIERLVAFYKA